MHLCAAAIAGSTSLSCRRYRSSGRSRLPDYACDPATRSRLRLVSNRWHRYQRQPILRTCHYYHVHVVQTASWTITCCTTTAHSAPNEKSWRPRCATGYRSRFRRLTHSCNLTVSFSSYFRARGHQLRTLHIGASPIRILSGVCRLATPLRIPHGPRVRGSRCTVLRCKTSSHAHHLLTIGMAT